MMISKIEQYVKGWLVGEFEPSLFKNKDVEVGLKYYNKGDKESRHVHDVITEYTIVVLGEIRMNSNVYGKGSVVKINPGTSTDFESLTDSCTLVIKTPSIPTDKRFV